MKKGLSDSNLQSMWRKACRIIHRNRCFVCGTSGLQTTLETHHYIKRNNLLTRHAWQNGFPSCAKCHRYLHTKAGEQKIVAWLAKNNWLEYLHERETQSKQWFVDRGITRDDYLRQMYNELKKIINTIKG